MNIGIFMLPYLPIIGGAQTQAHGLATALKNLDNDVTVYASKKCVNNINKNGWVLNYKLKPCNSAKYPLLSISRGLWYQLTKKSIIDCIISDKIEIVQLIMSWPWICVAKDIKKLGKPIILRTAGDDIQTDNDLDYGVRLSKKRNNLILNSLNYVDNFIAISDSIREEYLKLNIPKKKITNIQNGIDINKISNFKINKNNTRQKFNLPVNKKIIISVGRNHPKKGFIDLIDSLKILNKKSNKFAVLVVGEGSKNLLNRAKKIGQERNFFSIDKIEPKKNISFPSDDLISLYKSSDYFVLPSYIEGHPNVAVEASISGLPLILTNAPGCKDIIKHEYSGLSINTNSPNEISDSVIRLEKDINLKKKIIKNSKKKLIQNDWNFIAKNYLSLYKNMNMQLNLK